MRYRVGLRDGDVVALASHTVVWRIHATVGEHVVAWNALRHYGPVGARFEPHEPPPHEQSAGVLYAGLSIPTCVAEVFQRTRRISRRTKAPYLTGLRLTRTAQLLDLAGTWPTRAGASQAVSTGRHDVTSEWAREIRAAFPELDGVWYPSSMNAGEPCIALWDSAADALPDIPVVSLPLAHPGLADALAGVAERIGYRLL